MMGQLKRVAPLMWLVLGLAAPGCQALLGLDEPGHVADAGADGSGDAGLGMWSEPVVVVAPGSGGDDDPTLTPEMLEMYLNRGFDIYVARRSSQTAPWSPPVLVSELSTPSLESAPELSPDGLAIYFASDRPGAIGSNDIYVATRTNLGDAWGVPVALTALNSAGADQPCAISKDGLHFFLGSTRNGNPDLFVATRTLADPTWGTPVPIAELNTASNDYSAYVTDDQLEIYFDSNRFDASDLFVATRVLAIDKFGAPQPISELDSTAADNDPWLSPDRREIYFASDRSGTQAIYRSTR
jgi:hypothetical protein